MLSFSLLGKKKIFKITRISTISGTHFSFCSAFFAKIGHVPQHVLHCFYTFYCISVIYAIFTAIYRSFPIYTTFDKGRIYLEQIWNIGRNLGDAEARNVTIYNKVKKIGINPGGEFPLKFRDNDGRTNISRCRQGAFHIRTPSRYGGQELRP